MWYTNIRLKNNGLFLYCEKGKERSSLGVIRRQSESCFHYYHTFVPFRAQVTLPSSSDHIHTRIIISF